MDQKAAQDIIGLLVAPAGKQVPLSFSPKDLTQEQIADIRLAASRMSGFQRRGFMAEMSLKYCDGSPRLTESVFGWSRDTVETGLGEKRTGSYALVFNPVVAETSLGKRNILVWRSFCARLPKINPNKTLPSKAQWPLPD